MLGSWWKDAVVVLGGLSLVNQALKEWFGVTVLGKKIYRGAPAFWKAFIRLLTWRKSITNKLEEIKAELAYNGGSSTKDQIKATKIETNEIKQLLIGLIDRVRFNEIRLDVSDVINERMTGCVNKKGQLVSINDVFVSFFGYSEEDLLNTSYESIIDESDLERMQAKWERAVGTNSRFFEQLTMYKKTGEPVNVCMRGFPDIDGNGQLHETYYVTFEIKK